MPSSLSDVVFLAVLPVLVIILIFSAVLYLSRGRRRISVDLSGFGVKLSIDSSTVITPLPDTEGKPSDTQ